MPKSTLVLLLLLVGCGPARPGRLGGDQRAPFYTTPSGLISLHLHSNISKSSTPQELEWWREWLRFIEQETPKVHGLSVRGVIHIYKDRYTLIWRNAQISTLGVPQIHTFLPPLNFINGRPSAWVYAYVYKGQIHLTQGDKQTANGGGPHWLTHMALASQTSGPDDGHRARNWAAWDARFQTIAMILQAQR